MINPKTAMFGAISIFYTQCLYTFKTVTSLSVLWVFSWSFLYVRLVAATGNFGISWDIFNSVLLAVPHFWAIGWFCMKIMKSRFFYVANW
jgi:protoheme IX farnesyltransferase